MFRLLVILLVALCGGVSCGTALSLFLLKNFEVASNSNEIFTLSGYCYSTCTIETSQAWDLSRYQNDGSSVLWTNRFFNYLHYIAYDSRDSGKPVIFYTTSTQVWMINFTGGQYYVQLSSLAYQVTTMGLFFEPVNGYLYHYGFGKYCTSCPDSLIMSRLRTGNSLSLQWTGSWASSYFSKEFHGAYTSDSQGCVYLLNEELGVKNIVKACVPSFHRSYALANQSLTVQNITYSQHLNKIIQFGCTSDGCYTFQHDLSIKYEKECFIPINAVKKLRGVTSHNSSHLFLAAETINNSTGWPVTYMYQLDIETCSYLLLNTRGSYVEKVQFSNRTNSVFVLYLEAYTKFNTLLEVHPVQIQVEASTVSPTTSSIAFSSTSTTTEKSTTTAYVSSTTTDALFTTMETTFHHSSSTYDLIESSTFISVESSTYSFTTTETYFEETSTYPSDFTTLIPHETTTFQSEISTFTSNSSQLLNTTDSEETKHGVTNLATRTISGMTIPPAKITQEGNPFPTTLPLIILGIIAFFVMIGLFGCWFLRGYWPKSFRKTLGLSRESLSFGLENNLSIDQNDMARSFTLPLKIDRDLKRLSTLNSVMTYVSPDAQNNICVPAYLKLEEGFDFVVEKRIAKGGGGSVHMGRIVNNNTSTSKRIIVKKFSEISGLSKEGSLLAFFQEVAIMNFFRNSSDFAYMVGYSDDPQMIIMKFYPQGSLHDLVHGNGCITKSIMFDLFFGASVAVAKLHCVGITHKDIKPANILLEERNGKLASVLTDFGTCSVDGQSLSVKAFQPIHLRALSVRYASPELFTSFRQKRLLTGPVKKVDIFALAVTLFEMINRSIPWPK